jgi:glycolate oxidase FAD binding subunit
MRRVDAEMWLAHGRAADSPDGVTLRVGTLPDRLAHTATGIERAVTAVAPAAGVTITGAATLGALRAELDGVKPREGAALIPRLRALVEPVAGSVVVERASVGFRGATDPWGPVAPEAFALMRAIKDQFDPGRILNPGRFVGGL